MYNRNFFSFNANPFDLSSTSPKAKRDRFLYHHSIISPIFEDPEIGPDTGEFNLQEYNSMHMHMSFNENLNRDYQVEEKNFRSNNTPKKGKPKQPFSNKRKSLGLKHQKYKKSLTLKNPESERALI